MPNLKLFRKRIIPNECILLKDDIILSANDEFIITKWNALKPKKDLHHGYSCFFLKEGFKISKFYREDNSLMCWYCDIVDYSYDETEHAHQGVVFPVKFTDFKAFFQEKTGIPVM